MSDFCLLQIPCLNVSRFPDPFICLPTATLSIILLKKKTSADVTLWVCNKYFKAI